MPLPPASPDSELHRVGALLGRARVVLLVTLEVVCCAAWGSPRVHRRLPPQPAEGASLPWLALVYLLAVLGNGLTQAGAAEGALTWRDAALMLAVHALALSAAFAWVPARHAALLWLGLAAGAGVQLSWMTLGLAGALPPELLLDQRLLGLWHGLATMWAHGTPPLRGGRARG